jgi:molybdate/tungstate transport system substrate-binding protein
MGSVDAGRQITAGGIRADLYAPADYLDIDLLMKPAGYASFNIVFAHGRMVLAYSAKKVPSFNAAKWYEALTMPGVTIGSGNPFLDPGAYRAPMIFQLAQAYYKVPNLYNNLLGHVVIPSADSTFQFTYEHNARATANSDPDYRIIELPAEINMSDPAKDAWYKLNAVVVIPGLGTPKSTRTVAIPGNHVAWGITLMNDAPNKENAIKFLEQLLGAEGTASLKENGPDPLTPAQVSSEDFKRLPGRLKALVQVRK